MISKNDNRKLQVRRTTVAQGYRGSVFSMQGELNDNDKDN